VGRGDREALASGLPVICTEACGAGLDLVRTCFNGLVVTTDSAPNLANAMAWLHNRYDLLPEIGRRGQALAAAFSAQSWRRDGAFGFMSSPRQRDLAPNDDR